MASKNKQVLQKRPEEWRKFSYEHGNVRMSMDLRTDIKDHLASGLIVAKEFVADLEGAIAKLKNK